MNKNKLISLITSVALVFTITGCSVNNNKQTDTSDGKTYISSADMITEASETINADTTVPADPAVSAETIASTVFENAVKSAGLRYVPGNGTLCDEPDRMVQRKANNVSQIVGTLYNG